MRNAWVVLLLLSCGTPSSNDGGLLDSGTHDSGVFIDAGPQDTDAGHVDAGVSDAGGVDAGLSDAGHDAGVVDSGIPDAGHFDAGTPDAGHSVDSGVNGGDTCAMAPDVTAGGTFHGTTVGAQDQYGNGISASLGCPTGGSASGPEVTYGLSPTVTTKYQVTVTPQSGSFDPLLYVQGSCGGSSCIAGTSLNGAGESESVTFTVTGGTSAFIIVDGELGTSGAFDLLVEIIPTSTPDAGTPDAGAPDAGPVDSGTPTLNGGLTCSMAPNVTAGGTYRGTTAGGQDHYGIGLNANMGCPTGGAASGNDVAYLLNPLATTHYTVTVTPLNQQYDPLLYVMADCAGTTCLAGTTFGSAGQPETVNFNVTGGTSAFIIVDGELGTSGSFEISIVAQ